MKNSISTLLVIFTFIAPAIAQSYMGPGGPIQNNGQETYFPLTITGLPQQYLDSIYGIEEVCLDITHPAVEELQVFLESPSGIRVELSEGGSCKGQNYSSTCFSNKHATSVTLSTAPYSGSFRPIGYFGRFNNGQNGNGTWRLVIKDYLASANAGAVNSWSIKFSALPIKPVVFTSSDLPIVVINTNNQPITTQKMMVNAGVIYNGVGNRNYVTDPLNHYNGKALIKLRGNSSRHFEKKPYALETCDALGNDTSIALLGMPAENDWTLIAMYQDKSLIRAPLTYELARKMGHYATRVQNVEVMINNEYMGVYALMEKIKRDSNRVDVAKLTPAENVFPQMSGGYIFKIDRTDEPGWYSELPGQGQTNHFFYQYVYPEADDITIHQSNYIAAFVDSFETTMNSGYYADPWIGYRKYIAVPSFVDYFILNELSKNVDAYRLSTYLYKNNIAKSGKMHIGPVWDYDLAWHNCNYGNSFDPSGWQYKISDSNYPTPEWWEKFMQDPAFTDELYCRWKELRQGGALSDGHIYSYIDSCALVLNESQQRNFTQWPILGAYIVPNPQYQTGATYQTEVNDLKSWIANRLNWLDGAITGTCTGGVNEFQNPNGLVAFPNPGMGVFNFKRMDGMPVKYERMEVYNSMGMKVKADQVKGAGGSVIIDLSSQPRGVYVYRAFMDGEPVSGKLIVE